VVLDAQEAIDITIQCVKAYDETEHKKKHRYHLSLV